MKDLLWLRKLIERELKDVTEQLKRAQEKSERDILTGQRIAYETTLRRIDLITDDIDDMKEGVELNNTADDLIILAHYVNFPMVYYITDIDHADDTVTYYADGQLYTKSLIMNDDMTGFTDHLDEFVPFGECVRTGTMWGYSEGITIGEVTGKVDQKK